MSEVERKTLVEKLEYQLEEAIQGMQDNIQGDYWFGRFDLAREVLQIIDNENDYKDTDM